MSMISYGAGARYRLIGATMLSFYDWYADLPPSLASGISATDRRCQAGDGSTLSTSSWERTCR